MRRATAQSELLPFGGLENTPGGLDAKVHNGGTAATLTATTP